MRYQLRAYNTATASANKIHDDAVARQLGFRGGLVPGVDVYAYLCHLPAERWGRAWLERGTMTARFDRPVYDGDGVAIEGANGSGSNEVDDGLSLTLRNPGGDTCATATATLPGDPPEPPNPSDWPSGSPPLPDERPKATPTLLETTPLGSIEATFRADRATEYLDDIREHLPLFRDHQYAHPGWLLRFANYVLTANVALGPWIHVASTTQLLGVVVDGDEVETRALVTAVRERRGHRFVDLDVVQTVGDRPVARTAHVAIYEPRSGDPPTPVT